MKTFIVYNKENRKCEENALHCLESFRRYEGWQAELFNGCWPTTSLPKYIKKYSIKTGERTLRNEKIGRNNPYFLSCFYSHFELYNICVKLNEPVAIIDPDTICVDDFNIDFDYTQRTIIQLDAESKLNPKKGTTSHCKTENYAIYVENGPGVHPITYTHIAYNNQKSKHYRRLYLAGGDYIITPSAAEYAIKDCEMNGWLQPDMLFDQFSYEMRYVNPSPIEYVKSKELHTSTGHKLPKLSEDFLII